MFERFGVRGRLLLSFVGISGFAVLSAAAAMYSFFEVQRVLDKITEQRVPTALAALELSARVERVVAETPALLAANTPHERLEIWSKLGSEVEEIDTLLLLLRNRGFAADALVSLQNVLDPLRSNLLSLNTLAGERIVLADRKAILLDEMLKAHEDTLAVLGPWITNVNNDVQRLRPVVDDASLSAEERSTAESELIAPLTLLASLQQILQEVTETHESLVQTASAEKHERLDLLMLGAQWSMESLGTLATAVGTQPRQLVLAEVKRFRRFVDGENSIPSLRARELTILANGADVLRENARLSLELTESVELLVRGTKLDISEATSQARAVQTGSSITLILIVALSLASSVLIVWLYVGRNLIARLTSLSDSMLAISGGNLRATLPPTGNDEIGRMAAALTVFRDTAVEVEGKNLRQIAEARQRLIDAIENISEGFSFYDKDDRLVLSNRRLREMLYPGLEDTVKPGTSFATTIRNAAEGGLIRDAEGQIEEWIDGRMERHRNPRGAFVQRRSDGRWIEVTEHKTSEGGTVAIYADITERKRAETALLEEKRRTDEANELVTQKNQMLESLSAKLSKYLAPQVYSSIFSGQQSVEISSKRKKLTVFFSDIAGFTEITDKLESEELTGLLNNYLTEMSKIALKYGATIDKYIGDAVMLFFGDPETKGVKEDATACVKMAIAMQKRMAELQAEWRDKGLESPFQLRIGINSGFCTVGNFGSEDRMDYTLIGNDVNLASRLQAHADLDGILMTHATYSLVKDTVLAEEQSPLTVKGFSRPIRNYKVVGLYDDIADQGRVIQAERDGMKIALKLDRLTKEDKADTVKTLKEILSQLED